MTMMNAAPRRIRKRLSSEISQPQYTYYGSTNLILLKALRTNAPTTASPTSSPTSSPSTSPSQSTPVPSTVPTNNVVQTASPSNGVTSGSPITGYPSVSPTQAGRGPLVTFASFSPVFISVWQYSTFLGAILGLWIFYLLLPQGFRKRFFGAYPKRFRRVRGKHPTVGHWIYPGETNESVNAGGRPTGYRDGNEIRQRSRGLVDSRQDANLRFRTTSGIQRQSSPTDFPFRTGSSVDTSSFMPGKDKYYTGADSSVFSSQMMRSNYDTESRASSQSMMEKPPPSPIHPSIEKVPNNDILSETMKRLKGRGIRLIAHGVQCEPKRVWLRLEGEAYLLSWQTEFPRRVTNQSGEVSIVLMRGSIHKIALPNVLYIDVGKRTSALLKPENRAVMDSCCFSLLTQNGSLDLQTSSRLERDALVCCFSLILDQVHDRDWRQMYEEGSSVVSSSINTSQFASDLVEI